MRATLIIPTLNSASTLAQVLPPLLKLHHDIEIVISDDGSVDATLDLAHNLAGQVCIHQRSVRGGASVARNHGAECALGAILVFIDSDVVVEPKVVTEMIELLESRADLSAVFGCYAPSRTGEASLSRFRNLLHRYFHLHQETREVQSFWTGLGAVRAQVFREAGGFCPSVRGIEDVEFGMRLYRAGHKIEVDPRFQGTHLKNWTWKSMILTDIFLRAVPWTRLALVGRAPTHGLNLSLRLKAAPALLGLALLTLPFTKCGTAVLGCLYLAVNAPVYRYMARHGGVGLGLRAVLYLVVHHLCCGIGFLGGGWQALRLFRNAPAQSYDSRKQTDLLIKEKAKEQSDHGRVVI